MNRRDIQERIIAAGMVPVFNHADAETAIRVLKASYAGGIRAFEWTNRGDHALENFIRVFEVCRRECPGLHLGVGSILDITAADLYLSKGAEFLVSPVFDPELANFAKDAKATLIPGCGSVTEIHQAQKYGADLVKLFPGNVLGPDFVKAVLAPMPHTKIMPTGGVTPDENNLRSWFDAGVKCVGMGSKLYTRDLLEPGKEAELEDKVREVLTLIKGIRAK